MWKKRSIEEEHIPEPIDTNIWDCVSDICNTWMREDFCMELTPTCPSCQSPMQKESRLLTPIQTPFWTAG